MVTEGPMSSGTAVLVVSGGKLFPSGREGKRRGGPTGGGGGDPGSVLYQCLSRGGDEDDGVALGRWTVGVGRQNQSYNGNVKYHHQPQQPAAPTEDECWSWWGGGGGGIPANPHHHPENCSSSSSNCKVLTVVGSSESGGGGSHAGGGESGSLCPMRSGSEGSTDFVVLVSRECRGGRETLDDSPPNRSIISQGGGNNMSTEISYFQDVSDFVLFWISLLAEKVC